MFKFLSPVTLVVAFVFYPNVLFAQAPVVESVPLANPESVQGSANAAELFYQLQELQQEVMSLRGLVEQQAHEIKRLKQQRLDDYIDLDRRVSQLTGGGAAKPRPQASGRPKGNKGPAASGSEMQRYSHAIDLVLKQKNYDQAVTAFNQYLTDFPEGRYAPNAQYWLGEIYLLKKDNTQSRQWFESLLAKHPDHRKAPDARFKLGKIFFEQGDRQKATDLLQQAAASDSNAARLAKQFIQQNNL